MKTRPAIGTRVRFLANTGHSNLAGRTGVVVSHHADHIAFTVRLENSGEGILCDPINVRPTSTAQRKRPEQTEKED